MCLCVWKLKVLGRLTLTFLLRAAFILDSLCRMITCYTELPITKKSPFGNSLICETLRLGLYCLSSPIMDLQFLNFPSTPLSITGILLLRLGLGRTGVPKGGSEKPGLEAWRLIGLMLLASTSITSVNPSRCVVVDGEM